MNISFILKICFNFSNLFIFFLSIDCPLQGMLGTTGGRFLGPSGSQSHHRNIWPAPTTNGNEGKQREYKFIF